MNKKYIVRLSESDAKKRAQSSNVYGSQLKVYRMVHYSAMSSVYSSINLFQLLTPPVRTVENTRKRFIEQGFNECLNRKKRVLPAQSEAADGKQEAAIIAMRFGPAPKGYANWSLRLLSRKVVELGVVEKISHETVRDTLKNGMNSHQSLEYWVIPPEADAEFVACMEEVLDDL
ncbi:MAG: helix-turn-helix domain-containing protein [Bacteroidia bacterium]